MDAGRTREGFIAASVCRFHFVSGTLTVYADKDDNIAFVYNGQFPQQTHQGHATISRDRLLQIKFDKSCSNHSIAAKVIEEILAEDRSSDSTLNDAAEHLRGWNLATDAGNRHAALGVLTTMSQTQALAIDRDKVAIRSQAPKTAARREH